MPAHEPPTHADILARINDNERDRDQFRQEQHRLTGMIFQMLERIEDKLDAHDARLQRIEAKVMGYDRWTDRAWGAIRATVITGGILIGALWWLTKDRLGKFFEVSG